MRERKVAIVTGASRGIGKGIAIDLVANGFDVIVNYVNSTTDAEAVVAEIAAAGGRAAAVRADLSDRGGAALLFDAAEDLFGRCDVIINNAGALLIRPLLDMDEDDYERIVNLNQFGTFRMAKQAATRLHDGGRIINFSSTAIYTSRLGYVAYNEGDGQGIRRPQYHRQCRCARSGRH